MKKRVLFINPGKNDYFNVRRIHMGLTLLGGILTDEGHDVRVMDYAFLKKLEGELHIPSVEEIIKEFKPEVVGMSVFSYLHNECVDMIELRKMRQYAGI